MRENDRYGQCSVSSEAGIVPDHCGEKGAELEGKAFNLPVYLCANHHLGHELWVVAKRTRSQIQAAEMNFLLWLSHREGEDFGHLEEVWNRAAAS